MFRGRHETGKSGTGSSGTGGPPVKNHGRAAHATTTARDAENVTFVGLNPYTPIDIRQGAYLPHWQQDGATYAVCFRLVDSLPNSVLKRYRFEREDIVKTAQQLKRELSESELARLDKLYSDRIENYLDSGHGACWLKDERIARIVTENLCHFSGERYHILAWCIMPNHVHIIVQPKSGFELRDIVHSWKSFTAKKANQLLNRTGNFWQPEYYDHLIRDEKDFYHQVNYVLSNPAKAGLRNWKWVGSSLSGTSGTGGPPVNKKHGRAAHATGDYHGRAAHATGEEHGRAAHATITAHATGEGNEKILIGNTFPLVLVRRRVVIEPYDLAVLKEKIAGGYEIFSFWGHVGTLEAANTIVGADLTPRTERPALLLAEGGLPMLYGRAFKECFVLSPNYIGGFRPALGIEVTAEQIESWNLLRVVFE